MTTDPEVLRSDKIAKAKALRAEYRDDATHAYQWLAALVVRSESGIAVSKLDVQRAEQAYAKAEANAKAVDTKLREYLQAAK